MRKVDQSAARIRATPTNYQRFEPCIAEAIRQYPTPIIVTVENLSISSLERRCRDALLALREGWVTPIFQVTDEVRERITQLRVHNDGHRVFLSPSIQRQLAEAQPSTFTKPDLSIKTGSSQIFVNDWNTEIINAVALLLNREILTTPFVFVGASLSNFPAANQFLNVSPLERDGNLVLI